MANPNPVAARRAKRAARQSAASAAGTVGDLQVKLWRALSAADEILADRASDPALRLRALHALTQASGAYLKVLETGELEARLRAVEAQHGKATAF